MLIASACTSADACGQCRDIVTQVPWSAPERHTYELKVNGDVKGESVLSIDRDGERFVLKQHAADNKGNTDESAVTVDAATLRPESATHTVIDEEQRRVAEATYENVDKDCSSHRVVRITQNTYKPPDEATPESSRGSPLCVPEHSYDNDTSLFIWRTVNFEKGYTVTYRTIFSNRRDKQTVTLRVGDKMNIQTPAGDFEAWTVDITADQASQRAWFTTSSDHTLVAYQNESFFFRLKE